MAPPAVIVDLGRLYKFHWIGFTSVNNNWYASASVLAATIFFAFFSETSGFVFLF